ncbi:MAG TPA: hypothetical protein VM694_40725, partial [Polyangium sp.]|nr:hypothetical protein [Polyangium sp.]
PLAQLARHALELQYLGLASGEEPLPYFLDTSYFDAYFLRTKVYAEGEMRELLHSMQRLCHGYELDPEAFVVMP